MDLNGKAPLIERSVAWAQRPASGEPRTAERHRVRRRTRLKSETRARIRARVWLACVGALLVMAGAIYLALGRVQ